MTTSFDPTAWLDAADLEASTVLTKLDAENRAKGGAIIAHVRRAFEASRTDDDAPLADQIAAAKKVGEQFDQMLAALDGSQRRDGGPRRRDNDGAGNPAPPRPTTGNPPPKKGGFFDGLFGPDNA